MKWLKKILSFLTSAFSVGLLITFVFIFLSIRYYLASQDLHLEQSLFNEQLRLVHERTIDFRMKLRGERKRDSQIAILAIDEDSLQQLGHWPWPRHLIAQTIDKLFSYGARVLAFDVIFAEPDKKSAVPSLLKVKKLANINHVTNPSANQIIDEEIVKSDTDEILAQSIAKHSDRLVMGSYFEVPPVTGAPYQDLCFSQLFTNSDAYPYLSKEEPIVSSLDDNEVSLPANWSEALTEHLAALELQAIQHWFHSTPNTQAAARAVQRLLQKYNLTLTPNAVALIIQYWSKDQLTALKPSLKKLNAQFENEATADRFIEEIGRLFTGNDRVSINRSINDSQSQYCLRFMTAKDELRPKFERSWPALQKENESFAKLSFSEGLEEFKRMNLLNPVQRADRWWINIPNLAEKASHTGFFFTLQDRDGSIRRSPLVARSGSLMIPSISFLSYLVGSKLTASVTYKEDPYYIPPMFKQVTGIDLYNSEGVKQNTVPVDRQGHLPINYAGADRMFPYLSVGELLSQDTHALIEERIYDSKAQAWTIQKRRVDKAEFIKNKYFILGATAVGIYDLRVTPFAENYPGVETHANALDNLLRRDFFVTDPKEETQMPMFLFGLGLFFSFMISRFGALSGMGVTLLGLASVFYIDQRFIFGQGKIIVIIFPLAMILTLYFFLTFYKYFTEERQKKELKGTFQKYVSPAIVNEILKDPSNLELGGRKQMMSVFFSDVRGFTTISEKLDPRALSDLLNSYLTPMTEIVFKNRGTLDKYMGDAVMAFFGAPIAYQDHAACAVRCALQQIEKLHELQKQYQSRGLPSIDIGIGINTGEMSVGNMGSETVRSYTVMGDAVNLASRLEGINKEYGTRIIVSEFTFEAIKEKFICREVDWVRVKGKTQPVKIFEVLGEKTVDEAVLRMLPHYARGCELYHQMKFPEAVQEFSLALNIKPDDPVSQVYLERCQDYMETPPSDNWDGVFTMTSK